jgi:hypothetical protein
MRSTARIEVVEPRPDDRRRPTLRHSRSNSKTVLSASQIQRMKRSLLVLPALLPSLLSAQLTITDSLSTSALTTLLEGFNITISNVTVNCDLAAYGEFDGTSSIPIAHGLLISSGHADLAAGPNDSSGETYQIGSPGDADLDALVMPTPTYDACVLEFDCVPLGDTLLFNFAFASEEYLEWAGSAFNDVFAIWLSGPGFPIPTNVATIPGGIPVSINNVNSTVNSAYYIDNGDGFTAPFNSDPYYVQYDGFTQNLTVFAVVTPGATYHFKVAVADVSDQVLDTAVLLEAFSFRSVFGATGIPSVGDQDLSIRNNNGAVELILPQGRSIMTGRILDATGRILRTFETGATNTLLPMSGLRAGAYVVDVSDAQGSLRASFYYDAAGR